VDNDEEGARLTQREENRELIAKHRATVEPKGCPTPGACSCPGAIPDAERKDVMTARALAESIVDRATVDTPRTDSATVKMERLDGDFDEVVSAAYARTLERELINLKQRLLPQANGRAERADKARQMAVAERDEMLEKLRAATSMPCAPSATAAPPEEIEELGKYDNEPCGEGITLRRQWWSGGTWLEKGDRVVVLRPRMKGEQP